MHSIWRKATTLMLGLVGLSTLAAVSTVSLTANNLAGLRAINIRAYGDFTIDPGQSLLLTSEGDYVTYTVPLRSDWKIVSGTDKGSLEGNCSEQTTCEFRANYSGGEVVIAAHANGFEDRKTITISVPEAPQPVVNPFSDTLPDWAGTPIVTLQDKQILRGYDDGRFGAGDRLTRGQLITIFYRTLRAMNMIAPEKNCDVVFNDISRDHYAYEAACIFRKAFWIDSLSSLGPDEAVSRGETAALINRVLGASLLDVHGLTESSVLGSGPYFTDVSTSHTYYADTAIVNAAGIMTGNPDGTFGTRSILNRAEAATIFFRILRGA